jgi:hypothetical protein
MTKRLNNLQDNIKKSAKQAPDAIKSVQYFQSLRADLAVYESNPSILVSHPELLRYKINLSQKDDQSKYNPIHSPNRG